MLSHLYSLWKYAYTLYSRCTYSVHALRFVYTMANIGLKGVPTMRSFPQMAFDGAVGSHRNESSKAFAQWEHLKSDILFNLKPFSMSKITYDGFRPISNMSDIFCAMAWAHSSVEIYRIAQSEHLFLIPLVVFQLFY